MTWSKEFFKGIIKENPTLVMLLGTCPTLAMTTQAVNGLGMGLATTFVLLPLKERHPFPGAAALLYRHYRGLRHLGQLPVAGVCAGAL